MDHLQLFNKGLIKDTEVSLQPKDSVRHLENFRINSLGGNAYTIESVKGNLLSFSLRIGFVPVGACQIKDRIIIFSTNEVQSEIGYITIDNPVYTVIYIDKDLGFTKTFPIEARGYPENEKKEWVYWVDYNKQFRSLNLLSPLLTNYAFGTTLRNEDRAGRVYVVLNGSATYPYPGGTVYGAGDEIISLGGPPASGPVLGQVAGSHVIPKISTKNIDSNPEAIYGEITFKKFVSNGNIPAGTVQALYRLVNFNGSATPWSYVTKPVSLTRGNPGLSISDYSNYQGTTAGNSSQKGVVFTVRDIDLEYKTIEIAVIKSDTFNVYSNPEIVKRVDITGSEMDFEYKGNEFIANISIDDITQRLASIKTFRDFTINQNVLVPANIIYNKDLEFNASAGVVIKPFIYTTPSDSAGFPAGTTPGNLFGHKATKNGVYTFADNNYFEPGGKYYVKKGTIFVGGTPYTQGEIFTVGNEVGWGGGTTADVEIQPCVALQKYLSGPTPHYDIYPIEGDFYDMKGGMVQNKLMGYWRNQKYRFGVIVYDKFKNPLFVRWIGDKKVPGIFATKDPDTGANLNASFYTSDTLSHDGKVKGRLRHVGMEIDGLNLTEICTNAGIPVSQIGTLVGGFSIVRAERTSNIIAQGMIAGVVGLGGDDNPLRPYSTITGTDGYRFLFISPDTNFRVEGLPPSAVNGTFLQMQRFVKDPVASGIDGNQYSTDPASASRDRYEKLYEFFNGSYPPQPPPSAEYPNSNRVTRSWSLEAGQADVEVGSSTALKFSNVHSGGITDLGIGTRAILLEADYNGQPYNPGVGVPSAPIVNWTNNNVNDYGGNSRESLSGTAYISCGHFQEINDQVIADNTVVIAGKDNIVFNGIQVFGGDCFLNFYGFTRLIAGTMRRTTFVPLESNMNVALREGANAIRNNITFPDNVESYVYNQAYSNDEPAVFYPGLPATIDNNTRFEYRALYSQDKFNGELLDSFKRFLLNNFKDVEGRSGAIQNIRTKNGQTFYWQDRGIGYLPINERIAVSGGIGNSLTIGEGGKLRRFDEIKNFYGIKHRWGLAETEDGFAWWDDRRNEICYMTYTTEFAEIGTSKGLAGFLNTIAGPFKTIDNPYTTGVVAVYDAKYKEVLFGFKGVTSGLTGQSAAMEGFVLGFDMLSKQFSGYYTLSPSWWIQGNDRLFSSQVNNKIYIHDKGAIGKFYDVIKESVLGVVINPKLDAQMSFDNLQMKCAEIGLFNKLRIQTPEQFGEDLDLQNNENYDYYNGLWHSNFPEDQTVIAELVPALGGGFTTIYHDANTGRIINNFAELILTKDNANGIPLKLSYISTTVRKAY